MIIRTLPALPSAENRIMLDGSDERMRGAAIRTALRTGRTTTIGILRSPQFGSGTPLSSIFSVVYGNDQDAAAQAGGVVESGVAAPPGFLTAGASPLSNRTVIRQEAAAGASSVPPAAASPRVPPPLEQRTVLGIHSTQFYWEQLLRDRLPLPALAITLKISQLYSTAGDVDWEKFPDSGDWRAAGFERRTTHTFTNKWGNLVRVGLEILPLRD